MEEIYTLLNYIDSEMKGKRGAFPSPVDRNAVLGYTEKIRELLSVALNEKRIREEYIRAQRIVEFAEEERRKLVEESSIAERARERAEEIRQSALQRAAEVTAGAKASLQAVLESSYAKLDEALASVGSAIESLKKQK